jgi:hypothetical protein
MAQGMVQIELPADFLAEIQQRIASGYFDTNIQVTGSSAGQATIEVTFTAYGTVLQEFTENYLIKVDLSGFNFDGFNPYKIAAIYDNRIIGGSFDPETGIFSFGTNVTGSFTITYVESLRNIVIRLDSYEIMDLAGNAAPQVMDVLPVVQYDRVFIPLRFIAEALGASITWNGSAEEVTIVLDGKSLTFAIGETAPGMDAPARIINDRTFVPLRFAAEFFGAYVEWDEGTRTILIIR